MVKVWAEKEFRNLRRLSQAGIRPLLSPYTPGIPCPKVLLLKSHVLVMTLIGDHKNSRAAPRLKDFEIPSLDGISFKCARLTRTVATSLYRQILVQLWKLYHLCRLVHADLSEYNLLVHGRRADATLYMIDVSQSVEHDVSPPLSPLHLL